MTFDILKLYSYDHYTCTVNPYNFSDDCNTVDFYAAPFLNRSFFVINGFYVPLVGEGISSICVERFASLGYSAALSEYLVNCCKAMLDKAGFIDCNDVLIV